jgi:hypothetical protein
MTDLTTQVLIEIRDEAREIRTEARKTNAHLERLERRQAQLFRCVDIGAELFAMAASCVRAERDHKLQPSDGTARELADLFCRHARRKIDTLFRAIDSNDDEATYRLARGVLDERYAWLEDGIFGAPDQPAPVDSELPRMGGAAGA